VNDLQNQVNDLEAKFSAHNGAAGSLAERLTKLETGATVAKGDLDVL
jgi:hypothetical protein